MKVWELIRITHLADAIEVICDETGMTIPDCLEKLKGIDGLTSEDCKSIQQYHCDEITLS